MKYCLAAVLLACFACPASAQLVRAKASACPAGGCAAAQVETTAAPRTRVVQASAEVSSDGPARRRGLFGFLRPAVRVRVNH